MSDIEELAQLLGHPGDLDWSGEPFCFLEYEGHEQPPLHTTTAEHDTHNNDDEHHHHHHHHLSEDHHHQPQEQQGIQRPRLPSPDATSGNKRRMSEAFQCSSYPSHTCGPVLVPVPPAPSSGPAPFIMTATNDVTASSTSASRRTRESAAACHQDASPTPSVSSHSAWEEGESEGAAASGGGASSALSRTEAVALRMERKKTREKMRRQEVNDKFNELMDALAEVEATPVTAEQQQGRLNMDKGNFRVDVLSRAVGVIRRLNLEAKAGQDEVERLRCQLQQAGLSREQAGAAAGTGAGTARGAPCDGGVVPHVSRENVANVKEETANSSSHGGVSSATFSLEGKQGNKMAPPMWVTVPMWMTNNNNGGEAAKGLMLGSHADHHHHMAGVGVNGGSCNPATFPFGAMPFFMPPNGGAPIPAMAPIMMPSATSFSGAEVGAMADDGEELPTHAPCA